MTPATESAYTAGLDQGRTEGIDEEAQAWLEPVALLTETLAAWGLADGLVIEDRDQLLGYARQLAVDLGRLLGQPVERDRIPREVSAEVWRPGWRAWDDAYRALYWRDLQGSDIQTRADMARHEEIGRALGVPGWWMRQTRTAVANGCGREVAA